MTLPETSSVDSRRGVFSPLWTCLGVGLALVGLVLFVIFTPPSLLDKVNYIGAAVCHRIPSHSLFIDEHQLPLCQRCSGTFPGALTGALVHWVLWRRRRSQGFPRWPFLVAFAGFAALWGLDGVNSYTTMLLGRPVGLLGYEPQPWVRLLTGVLMGSGMSAILVPAFNQTMWADGEATATLRSWHEFALLVAIELALGASVLTLEPWLLYPVALYSALGVMMMFVLLGAMMFVMFLRQDRAFVTWRDLWVPLIWGLVFAFAVVGVMDVMRLVTVGSFQGVPGVS